MNAHTGQRHGGGDALRGFGTDPIRNDMPLGSAASLLLHGGFVLVAMFAWQVAPTIVPEDVIAVDVISDNPSVVGKNAAPETAQVGVETAAPSPLPQPLPSSEPETVATPEPMRQEAQTAVPPPPESVAPPILAPLPPPPPPQPVLRQSAAPTPRPLPPQPIRPPPPPPSKAVARAPAPQRAPAPARPGRAREPAATPAEFDLSAASSAASGADSGGRRSPQLASPGNAGRPGKAGGGSVLTGDLEAALRAQVKECWAEPADMSNPRGLLVVVNIELGIDGRLTREPQLVSPSSKAGASPSLVVAIDNALRAVRQCAPFTLPPDRYESWRSVAFSFDPRRMTRP
jgi:hypothetical protein